MKVFDMSRKNHPGNKRWTERRKKKNFSDSIEFVTCPRPDKYHFNSESMAEDFINSLYSRSTRRYGQHYLPRRAYLCSCGSWHVTSHPEVPSKVKKVERTSDDFDN